MKPTHTNKIFSFASGSKAPLMCAFSSILHTMNAFTFSGRRRLVYYSYYKTWRHRVLHSQICLPRTIEITTVRTLGAVWCSHISKKVRWSKMCHCTNARTTKRKYGRYQQRKTCTKLSFNSINIALCSFSINIYLLLYHRNLLNICDQIQLATDHRLFLIFPI